MNQEEARLTAYRIKEHWEEIAGLWEITKHFDNTGQELKKQQTVKLQLKAGESLTKRLHTLRTYLSPSCLKRVSERRRTQFEADSRAELAIILKYIDEQEDQFIQV